MLRCGFHTKVSKTVNLVCESVICIGHLLWNGSTFAWWKMDISKESNYLEFAEWCRNG